ncbi:MAG: hypothetical protein KGM15_11985 [Pseudomonadota bacterium]|nr:hypothetical protein [Pseudomonadota bacterium]
MKLTPSSPKVRVLGPHSRVPTRGAVGDGVDGRSREGRFLRQTERELLIQFGREPSFGERLLIRRIARAMLQLELFDQKPSTDGEFTAHDARAFSALSNQVRLGLRDIGLKSAPKDKPATVAEIAARCAQPRVAAE